MEDVLSVTTETVAQRAEQNHRISEVIQQERRRLLHFIRKRVDDEGDAEDILQDVFYELTEAYRLMKPIEQAGACLYRGGGHRIIDPFRKQKPDALVELEDLLPARDAGPEAAFARRVLLEELDAAIDELPPEQRDV